MFPTKKIVVLVLSFFVFNFVYSNSFQKLYKKIENENNITILEKLKLEEQKKFDQSKKNYYLNNVIFIESVINKNNNNINERLKNLIWITEHCENNESSQLAWVNYDLAIILVTLNSNEQAKLFSGKSLNQARKIKDKLLISLNFSLQADIFYKNRDFSSAIKYYNLANTNNCPDNSRVFSISMKNNIGVAYLKLDEYNEAYQYFKLAFSEIAKMNKKDSNELFFEHVIEGNIGTVLSKLGNYVEAEKRITNELNFYFSLNKKNKEAIGSLIELVNIYENLHNKIKVEQTILKIEELEFGYNLNSSEIKLTEFLYNYYLKNLNKTLTIFYSKKLIEKLKNNSEKIKKQTASLNEILFSNKINNLKQEVISNKKILTHVTNEKNNSQLISFILIIIVLLIISITLIIYFEKRKHVKKDNLIFQQTEINKRIILENELNVKEQKITNFALSLSLKKDTEKAFLSKIKEIRKRKNININIEEDLKELQFNIDNLMGIDEKILNANIEANTINQEFKAKLKQKHNDLTDFDLNYCCYFKLKLRSKEIAAIFNLSDISIRVIKNKIKNKIGLSQKISLTDYLNNFELES